MTERRFSGSEAKTFRRCKRRWWLEYVLKLTTEKVDAGALSLGSTTHLGFEHLTRSGDLQVALDMVLEFVEVNAHRAVDLASWRSQGQWAQEFLIGYKEWLEETGADQRYEHLAEEEELEMPIVEIDGVLWILMGKLDRRVFDRIIQMPRFMDYKTVASFKQIIEDAPRNEQFPTYDLLMRYRYGETVGGGIWRMIRKVKRAKESNEPFFMDYERTYNRHVLDNLFERYRSLAHDMHQAEEDLGGRMDDWLHNRVVPPTPDFRCSWDCQFVGVCDMFDDGSRVESALHSLYVVGDPYERYKLLGKEET